MLAAGGAVYAAFVDKGFHFFVAHRVDGLFGRNIMTFAKVFDELVGSKTRFTFRAVNHGVGKMRDVSGRFPRPPVHENRCIKSDNVVVELRHLFPPCRLNILF